MQVGVSLRAILAMIHGIAASTPHSSLQLAPGMHLQLQGPVEVHQAPLQVSLHLDLLNLSRVLSFVISRMLTFPQAITAGNRCQDLKTILYIQ